MDIKEWYIALFQGFTGALKAKMINNINGYGLPKITFLLPSCVDHYSSNIVGSNLNNCVMITPLKETVTTFPTDPRLNICHVKFLDEFGLPVDFCPISLLEKAINKLEQDFGISVKGGFELEFQVFRQDTNKPIDNSKYCNFNGLIDMMDDLLEITKLLKEVDIQVDTIHKESAPGQVEIVLHYDEINKAVQQYYYARAIIQSYYRKQKLRAVFLPKTAETIGNGCHVHLSIWKNGECILGQSQGNYGLSKEGENFIAGILSRYDSLIQFLAPSPNGCRRIKPNCFVGAYKIWGIENKESPIRVCAPLNKLELISHFEIKTLDHSSNIFYALAVLIEAGYLGIKGDEKLPPPTTNYPIPSGEQLELLPTNFEQRKEILMKSIWLQDFLGEEFLLNYLATVELEFEHMKGYSIEQEVESLVDLV